MTEEKFSPTTHFMDLMKDKMQTCKMCKLCESRTNVVFGSGPYTADIMLVGEGPGEKEDKNGVPFIGKAGELLTEFIEGAGFNRETDMFITNSVLCRPPDNRNPLFEEEIQKCQPRLLSQIYLIQPKLIVAAGAIAAQALLGNRFDPPLKNYVGKCTDYAVDSFETKLFITYHPSYIIRQMSKRPIAEQHWHKIRTIAELLCPSFKN